MLSLRLTVPLATGLLVALLAPRSDWSAAQAASEDGQGGSVLLAQADDGPRRKPEDGFDRPPREGDRRRPPREGDFDRPPPKPRERDFDRPPPKPVEGDFDRPPPKPGEGDMDRLPPGPPREGELRRAPRPPRGEGYQPPEGRRPMPMHSPEAMELMQKDRELEHETRKLAARFAEAPPEAREAIQKELVSLVEKHFNLRQEGRRQELKRLEGEIQRLREAIEQRDRGREQIIKRRVAELSGVDDQRF